MRTIFFDGQYSEVDTQIIEAFTPGNFRAHGVFETMLGLGSAVLDADMHLKRMGAGLKILGLRAPALNPSVLKEVLRRNHLTCARVRLMVWQSHVMIAALPYKMPDKKIYHVCLVQTKRAANDLHADVKSLDYELSAQAFSQALAQGYDEALLLNRDGHIFEASRANIFWAKDKVLYTPPLSSGCLNGITRGQVIKEARKLKIPVKEMDLTPRMLKEADSAFLTNSLMGIKPIETDI